MRKGHISLILCDFAYIMTFLCFQGEPSGFTSKNSILGGLRRKVEVRGSLGHQEQGNAWKRAKHGRASRPHGRAPRTRHDQPARHLARAGRAWWHDRATCYSLAVPRGTVWPCHMARPCHLVAGRGLNPFRDFFSGIFFHSASLFCFSSCFQVLGRDLRESKKP